METFMWRILRVAILFASCGLLLTPIAAWYGWGVWLVVTIVPTALLDLWLESIKPAGSDKG